MDESQVFRRSFAAGTLALAIAVCGQLATSTPASTTRCPERGSCVFYLRTSTHLDASLTERVARAVIGAVLSGFC